MDHFLLTTDKQPVIQGFKYLILLNKKNLFYKLQINKIIVNAKTCKKYTYIYSYSVMKINNLVPAYSFII